MRISSFNNSDGVKIFSRDDRLLCSPRNPIFEAKIWLQRQNIKNGDQCILLIGFGAGYHAMELKSQFGDRDIHILELDKNIHPHEPFHEFLRSAEESLLLPIDVILSFRPAWAGMVDQYLQVAMACAQKTAKSFRESMQARGLHNAAANLISEQFQLSNLSFEGADPALQELKIWRCLRELSNTSLAPTIVLL